MADSIARATARLGFGMYYGRKVVHRDLQSLKNCKLYLRKNVQSIRMNVLLTEPENEGGRRFLWEQIPGLRYKNPHVQFSFGRKDELPARVTINFDDGQEITVDTLNKSVEDICHEVFSKTVEDYSIAENEEDKPDIAQQQTHHM